MAYFNPYISGWYNPLYHPTNQGFFLIDTLRIPFYTATLIKMATFFSKLDDAGTQISSPMEKWVVKSPFPSIQNWLAFGYQVKKYDYTPEDLRLEPENSPLEKENHLNQTIMTSDSM